MKKILLSILCIFATISVSQASSVQMHVSALQEFQTDKPSNTIKVKVLKNYELGNNAINENAVLTCDIIKITDPKRGKRDASFIVKPVSYYEDNVYHTISDELYGKYSKTVLSKEELKKIPPGKVLKKAALTVGSFYIKGLSTMTSFATGVVKNDKGNRLKSGVCDAYEESPLSYVSKGEQLDLKVGDEFYLIFKVEDEEDMPNYSYTVEE